MGALVVVCVAFGGLVGAPARFVVDRLVSDRRDTKFPMGTFLVNISGAFLLGVVTGVSLASPVPELLKAFLATGFCGAYTTFSTWSFETLRLVEDRDYLAAFVNAVGGLLIGLVAAGAGIAVGRLL
jgi:CrcB protein